MSHEIYSVGKAADYNERIEKILELLDGATIREIEDMLNETLFRVKSRAKFKADQ